MAIEARQADKKTDLADLCHVWSAVYHSGKPYDDPQEVLREDGEFFLAYLDGQPSGAYELIDYEISRGPSRLKCGGIAAVAVLPEARTSGVGRQMMSDSLHEMFGRGFDIAALYAFSERYYRQFGYATCGRRVEIVCPSSRFPVTEQQLPIRRIDPSDVQSLNPALHAFNKRVSGSCFRTPVQWSERLGKTPPMIYAVGDPVEAYCWTRMDGGFWEDLMFGELVWGTPRGYESILAAIRGLIINRSAAQFYEPSSSPFLARYLDQGVKVSHYRNGMFRLINVASGFEKLHCDEEGSFGFELHDSGIPENSGTWTVRFDAAGTHVSRGGSPGLRFSIGELSQAFMGEPSLMELAAAGTVEVIDSSHLDSASKLLPHSPVFLSEYF